MSDQPTWYVGDRLPVIGDTLTIDEVPVDLSAKTVTFRMRAVGSTALIVDAPVTTKDESGAWTYAWDTGDLASAGEYLVWLDVQTSGYPQTLWEQLVLVREHGPGAPQPAYIELEQLKSSMEIAGTSYADTDLLNAAQACSRAVDTLTKRRFWPDADNEQVRYYTPISRRLLMTDDIIDLKEVAIDRTGGGTFTEIWTLNTDFILEPANAVADFFPYDTLRVRSISGRYFPYFGYGGIENGVRVTAQFGWSYIPPEVTEATRLLAVQLARRTREAPFGIVSALMGEAVRLGRWDPDVTRLLKSYTKPDSVAA